MPSCRQLHSVPSRTHLEVRLQFNCPLGELNASLHVTFQDNVDKEGIHGFRSCENDKSLISSSR
jgi:hypothetical protein